MTDREKEQQAREAVEQSPPAEAREKRRLRIIATGFFLFFVILWLVIHFFNRTFIRGGAHIGQSRFKVVDVPPGSGLSDIADKLAAEEVIASAFVFKAAATARRSTRELKAGEYRLDTEMSPLEVLKWIEQGRVMLHEFTVPEGYTARQIAMRMDELGLANGEDFLRLVNDPEFCEQLGIDSPTLEGFLYPDTYKVAKGLPTKTLIRIMVDCFWSVCGGEIAVSGLELIDVVTVASIIEKEALADEEEPLIAGVIYNRLKLGIPLQCDVTIRYPLDNYGAHLTYADLKMDSPYNSYLYPGLPPTPICNPGLSAIRAALMPAETDYLYFVSMNNGRHKFSTSLGEHNKAVVKYQILNERG